MELEEPYRARPVRSLGVERFGDWRLKVYGIAYGREVPRDELLESARAAAHKLLPEPAVTATRYGVGFLGVHDGRGGNFVFVDWWEQENELHHHVYFSTSERPGALRPASHEDPVACVWDLSVVGHEREAWVRHVLGRGGGPDLDAYLEDRLDAEV